MLPGGISWVLAEVNGLAQNSGREEAVEGF